MRKLLAFTLFLLVLSPFAAWADPVGGLYVGANGLWNASADPFPAEVEAAVNGSASLSPHLTLVGEGDYGFSQAYFRGSAGVRATATDVDNKDFSIGLGIGYHVASAEFQNEWAPECAVGWRPWPAKYPKLLLGGRGWYGLTSKVATATVGARWAFNF